MLSLNTPEDRVDGLAHAHFLAVQDPRHRFQQIAPLWDLHDFKPNI